jgi:hypothetical protein
MQALTCALSMSRAARIMAAGVLALHGCLALAGTLATGVPESFSFSAPGAHTDKPVTVHYYKPLNATADAKVLFAIHGVERAGSRARDHWVKAAEKYGAIILAPEFDQARFPNRLFQMGGMEARNPADWTFHLIENLFEKLRVEEGLNASTYLLFGHSAGAQYVHRHLLMMDKSRIAIAVAANAGTYTFPVYSQSIFSPRFPWTLDERLVDRPTLKERFGRNLVILLGEEDVKTTGDFPSSREAMVQGSNRLERGRNFCEAAAAQARELGADFRWRCITMPGVGHNSAQMSRAAARILFEAADHSE